MDVRLNVVDNETRRITEYGGWSGPLVAASFNPKTVEEFAEVHDRVLAPLGPLFRVHRISDKRLQKMKEDATHPFRKQLLYGLSCCETPIWTLEDLPLEKLLELAKQPDFRDYKSDEIKGTGLKPTKTGVSYDAALVIDLRAKLITFAGRREEYEDMSASGKFTHRKPKGKEDESFYCGIGFLSDTRKGHACFKDGQVKYELGLEWTIKDARNGRLY